MAAAILRGLAVLQLPSQVTVSERITFSLSVYSFSIWLRQNSPVVIIANVRLPAGTLIILMQQEENRLGE